MSITGLPQSVKGRVNASAKYLIHHMRVRKITVFVNKMENGACFTGSDGKSDTKNDSDDVEDTDDITVTRKQSVTVDLNNYYSSEKRVKKLSKATHTLVCTERK